MVAAIDVVLIKHSLILFSKADADASDRLEAAHHHCLGRLSKSVEDKLHVKFSPPALAAIGKLSLHYIEESATDLEAFSK